MNIKDLIGETTEYEKKVALETKKPKSWCKTISAFANGKGGKLIFGVDDNDNIVGLTNMKKDSEDISEIIKTHLNPIPKFDMNFKSIDGKDIIVLEVFAGEQTPYYYDGAGQLIAYLRIGNESVPASPIELQELVLRGTNTSYDSLKAHYNFDEMSFSKLKSVYKQNTGNSFEDTDYESFGIVNSKGELTNAGVLIADECPLRHSRVFCTRWNGLTKASGLVDAIDDKDDNLIPIPGKLIYAVGDYADQHNHVIPISGLELADLKLIHIETDLKKLRSDIASGEKRTTIYHDFF